MTIKEFAQTIGVSPSTVSRAMHGRGRISASTRRLVTERAKELGFTPNLNAQRLSHGRTNMVALDFGPWRDYLSDMFFVEITRGLQDELEAHGYGILLSGPGDVLHRWVKTRAVDGVILVGDLSGGVIPREIAQTGTPCVVIGNRPVEGIPSVRSVVVELRSGAQQVAQFLVEHGHREIGFIGTDPTDAVLPVFRSELERLGLTLPESRVVMSGPTPRDGARALCDLLAHKEPPTAVFVRTDGLAAGVLRAAHQLGIQVPDQLSIIGHDDVPFAELTEPPLTTVRVDSIEIARLTANALFSLLQDPAPSPGPQTVQTRLVVRGTVSALWSTGSGLSRSYTNRNVR